MQVNLTLVFYKSSKYLWSKGSKVFSFMLGDLLCISLEACWAKADLEPFHQVSAVTQELADTCHADPTLGWWCLRGHCSSSCSQDSAVTHAYNFRWALWGSTSPPPPYLLSMTGTTLLPVVWYSMSSSPEPWLTPLNMFLGYTLRASYQTPCSSYM